MVANGESDDIRAALLPTEDQDPDNSYEYSVDEPIKGGCGGIWTSMTTKKTADAVSPLVLVCYGMGTILNDMCAALWFSYLLKYLDASGLDGALAGAVLLSGQIADGLATPLAGWLCDKTDSRFGRRKIWIFGGSVLVIVSFAFVFGECYFCDIEGEFWQSDDFKVVYYAVFASIFNFGWAATQVSHMALVCELSGCDQERLKLNSSRFACTATANLLVYGLGTVIFHYFDGVEQYRQLAYGTLGMGTFFMILCLAVVPEPPRPEDMQKTKEKGEVTDERQNESTVAEDDERVRALSDDIKPEVFTWKSWFGVTEFYINGAIYMLARLILITFQTFFTFYISYSLGMGDTYTAAIPGIQQAACFGTTPFLKKFNARFGRHASYGIGSAVCILAAFIALVTPEDAGGLAFLVSILIGMGTTAITVGAMTMISDLVGCQLQAGAFVYGAYGLLEKFSSGLVIYFLQATDKTKEPDFARYIFTTIPSGAAAISLVVVFYGHMVQKRVDAKRQALERGAYSQLSDEA